MPPIARKAATSEIILGMITAALKASARTETQSVEMLNLSSMRCDIAVLTRASSD